MSKTEKKALRNVLSRSESAIYCNLSLRKFDEMAKEHQVPKVKQGMRVGYRIASLNRYLKDMEVTPALREVQ